jgi:hypothetical protein
VVRSIFINATCSMLTLLHALSFSPEIEHRKTTLEK